MPGSLSAALTPRGYSTSLPGHDSLDDYSFPILLHACHDSRPSILVTFTLCGLSYHHAIHPHRFSHIYTFTLWT